MDFAGQGYESDGDLWDECLSDIPEFELREIENRIDQRFGHIDWNMRDDLEQEVVSDWIQDEIRNKGYRIEMISRIEVGVRV